MLKRLSLALAASLLVVPSPLVAQSQAVEDSAFMAGMRWRSLGPAIMSGRVTDIEGIPGTATFYVASASGGIWKTTNSGTTFRPLFQNERVVSMGDIAIAPSDPDVIWAGTGEEDSRNSISPGGGIYKSTDGGLTWELKGLEDTQAIGKVLVHPTNPDLVYVAALGHPWGHNEERGLYRTSDGGETWERVHHISDKAGFVDMAMHPQDPDVIFASSWERVRGPWFFNSGGPGSALWKTSDGGDSWTEVTGGGFPETEKGRIGVAIARSNPGVMYALVEARDPERSAETAGGNGDDEEELHGSGLYRSDDGGATWKFMNSNNSRPFYYSRVWVDPSDPDLVFWSSFFFSRDGGETVGTPAVAVHSDHHALWWDTENPEHFVVGNDGGIAITWDRGGNYDFPNTFPLGQFYAVSFNMDMPYRVCGGLQDNYTWCGPSRRSGGVITNHDWYSIGGGDGFYAPQDPTNPDIAFGESQGGNVYRVNTRTGERQGLEKPSWREKTKALRDSVVILRGEGDEPPSADVQARIEELEARVSADSALWDLRYNWNTPLELSPHDPSTLYIGANRVLKWTVESNEMVPMSPDLTYADPDKIRISHRETGGITRDVTGAEYHATLVALAESPINEGELYAGSDDGRVWKSPNSGVEWIELTDRFEGVPPGTYVSRMEPSSHDASRFYVTFDGHRNDDYTPYVYATDDGGETFRSITSDLPTGGPDFVHVVREDPVNPDLLYAGTDVGAYVSTDRGGSWTKFMTGLPTVPVHDLKIHPRDGELIAGTHGRSIWIVDVTPLQQLSGGELPADVMAFEPAPGLQHGSPMSGGEFTAQRFFRGQNRQFGAEITYWVPEDVAEKLSEERRQAARERMQAAREAGEEGEGEEGEEGEGEAAGARARGGPPGGPGGARGMAQAMQGAQAQIAILNADGDTVQTMTGGTRAGLNRVYWNLRSRAPEREPLSPSERADSIANTELLQEIADSLIAEGANERAVQRVVELTLSGNRQALFRAFGGGGGGGQGRPGEFVERAGERYPQTAQRGQEQAAERTEQAEGEPAERTEQAEGRARAGRGPGGPPGQVDQEALRNVARQMFRAMRDRGQGFGGFGGRRGGGGGGDLVDPGVYTVAITLGEQTFTTSVEVRRQPGYGELSPPSDP